MSVIYESLSKLTNSGSSRRSAKTAGKPKRGSGRGILSTSSSSPKKSVLGLAIIVVVVGLFGYMFLDELKGLGGTRIELPDKSLVVVKPVPQQTQQRPEIKAPAKIKPEPDSADENLAADSQYLPPQKDAVQTPEAEAAAASAEDKISAAGAQKPAQPEKTATKKTDRKAAAAVPAAPDQSEKPAQKAAAEENKAVKKKKRPKTQEEKHLEILTQEHNTNQLIKKIKFSMASGDSAHTEKLFARLEKMKGRNNSYVLKLKAFWHMQRGDYQAARPLLAKVLSRNENDREAGLNMSVLEINTDQIQQARARLRKLKDAYPDDSSIHELYIQLD